MIYIPLFDKNQPDHFFWAVQSQPWEINKQEIVGQKQFFIGNVCYILIKTSFSNKYIFLKSNLWLGILLLLYSRLNLHSSKVATQTWTSRLGVQNTNC